MDNERDLDRLIDEAARQMAQGEPSDALSGAVMARVEVGAKSFAHGRLMWGSVAAAMALAGLMVAVEVNRTAAPSGTRTPDSGLRAADARPAREAADRPQGPEPEAQRPQPVSRQVLAAAPVAEEVAAAETDDPITFESIEPAPIEVERLEVTSLTTIDPIEIAPIEIAPISTSDD